MVNLTENNGDQHNLVGENERYIATLEQVSYLAKINRPILIVGERGTGKELIAKRLHYLSARWQQPFVSLNCASLNENLVESELFGYESGAFTGAQKRHLGRFERAHQGTLFLDELATAPTPVQEKLLRVIEYGEFERVGGKQIIKVDVRIIAATNDNLPQLAQLGKFRADLLDRLAFDVVTLPPLRQRPEDILLLAHYFAQQFAQELAIGRPVSFSPLAQQTLQHYDWPGNIRELKNVVERSLYRDYPTLINQLTDKPLHIEQIIINAFNDDERPVSRPATSLPIDLKQHLQQQEIEWLQQALVTAHYNQRKAAQLLNLTYYQWRGLLKKYADFFPDEKFR